MSIDKISIVLAGPLYKEFDLYYSVKMMKDIFTDAEIILSTNDTQLIKKANTLDLFDKIVECNDIGELPSLKFPGSTSSAIVNNNIKKQIDTSLQGIKVAQHPLVLKLRTDQFLFNSSILSLWNIIKDIPTDDSEKKGRIITSSIFSINPRYSERMPYHISDMLQFGYKEDLIAYYSAPEFPIIYATWYERNKHIKYSNLNEREFRAKFAVEQWLCLNYIFKNEKNFPINFHNHVSPEIVKQFETIYPDYFIIAHPDDIALRASKFSSAMSYVNNQCYSTYESLSLLISIRGLSTDIIKNYSPKGINKKLYKYIRYALDRKFIQLIIRIMPSGLKMFLKSLLR